MRPKVDQILNAFSMNLATRYLPALEKENDRTDMGLMVFILGAVAEEYERGAQRCIEENKALRQLFREALDVVADVDLKKRLTEAAETTEADFHMSALDKSNCALRALLIALQAHVESLETGEARVINEKIWKELDNYAGRREFKTWDISMRMIANARITEARAQLAEKAAAPKKA